MKIPITVLAALELGPLIRTMRDLHGWSQSDLGSQLESWDGKRLRFARVSRVTISDWERGAALPRRRNRVRLAEVFGLPPRLFGVERRVGRK